MSRVCRAITAFFLFLFFFFSFPPSIFLFSIIVVISSFIECMPVESPFPPPFPQILGVCVCVCGWVGEWVHVQARVSVREWVSVCVCCNHLFKKFTLVFVLVMIFLWFLVVSCLGNAYVFVFVFVAVCLFLLYALVFYVYWRVIPDVLSLMFFHVPPLGFLK